MDRGIQGKESWEGFVGLEGGMAPGGLEKKEVFGRKEVWLRKDGRVNLVVTPWEAGGSKLAYCPTASMTDQFSLIIFSQLFFQNIF